MCDFEEADDVTSTKTVRARKDYTCVACGEAILRTHLYMRTGSLFDGSWSTWRHCLRCWAMIKSILKRGESVQWDLGCGIDWKEAFNEEPPPEVARLAFMTAEEAQKELLQK